MATVQPDRTACPAARGLTIIEVMISSMILAVILTGMLGYLGSLHQARTADADEAMVNDLLRTMAERFLGASWNDLGRRVNLTATGYDPNAWSWPRRATPRVANDPWYQDQPLTEDAQDPNSNLIRQGISKRTVGIEGLRVYVEYLRPEAIIESSADPDPQRRWQAIAGVPYGGAPPTTIDFLYPPSPPAITNASEAPDSPDHMNLRSVNTAIAVRILVSWRRQAGGTGWRELTILRKK
jgi:hypothetical protein